MNYTVYFSIHGALNDFLMPQDKNSPVAYKFSAVTTVKDAIESIGIPHPEVGLLLVGSEPVDEVLTACPAL